MAKKATKSSIVEQISSELGKIPPQAIDLEEAVLGAAMLDKDAATTALEILKAECFYKESNRIIFQAISELSKELKPVDILTVKDQLAKNKQLDLVGGPLYLSQLTSRIASAAHLEFHARIVAQKYIQRELIRISTEIEKRAYDDSEDVDDLLDSGQNELFKLSEGTVRREAQPIEIVLEDALKQIELASQRVDGLSGVPSGFSDIDRVTSGWQHSDLVIVAARPSMGKTAFVLSMTRNMAIEHQVPVAIFSLEMSSVQLVNRFISIETSISADKIRTGRLAEYEWQHLHNKLKKLVNAKIFIDDTPAISIYELRAKCRRLVSQHGVKAVIIDYLQLMSGPDETKGSREQEVSTISRSLKALAKDLNVPVLALSQLNRSLETRAGDKRPQLSDLRESGAIEQDADIVIFIHRPEKFGITEDKDGNPTKGLAEIIIAKHRNGAVCDVPLKFIDKYAKFTDYNDPSVSVDDEGSNSGYVIQSSMNEKYLANNDFDIQSNKGFDQQSGEAPF